MNILLVEDEERLSSYLERALKVEGFATCVCGSVDEVQALISTSYFEPEVVILDRLLRGVDSLNLIEPLREKFPRLRILILSAITTAEEKAMALDAGADDYMSKPFSSRELLARLKALTRRQLYMEENSCLTLSNVMLEFKTRTVLINGTKVNLTNKEFLLALNFMREPGRVFSKADLFKKVWNQHQDTNSNVVEVTINNLRRKLKESESHLKIMSRRNLGYWLEN